MALMTPLSDAASCAGDYRSAADLLLFLRGFLERFPQYEGRPFWITGESYGDSSAVVALPVPDSVTYATQSVMREFCTLCLHKCLN